MWYENNLVCIMSQIIGLGERVPKKMSTEDGITDGKKLEKLDRI